MMISMLPSKASELLQLGLENMKLCEQSPHYVIDFTEHHSGIINSMPCKVSITGAVMAQTLKSDPFIELSPKSFDEHISVKLWALFYMQRGDVERGIDYLGLSEEFTKNNKLKDQNLWSTSKERLFNIPFYRDRFGDYPYGYAGRPFDSEIFYRDMYLLIEQFKKIHL